MSEKKRCYRCHCLEIESTYKWNIRTRYDLSAKFFCRKCVKKQDVPLEMKEEKIIKFDFKKVREISYDSMCMFLLEKQQLHYPLDRREIYILGNMKRKMSGEYVKKILDTLKSTSGPTPFYKFTQEEMDSVISQTILQNRM